MKQNDFKSKCKISKMGVDYFFSVRRDQFSSLTQCDCELSMSRLRTQLMCPGSP